MPLEAKHLQLRETHQIENTQTTSFGRTNNAPRSKTFMAPQNAPNSKNQNYIFRTNEQCPAKRNTYGSATKQKPKLHLSDERTVLRKAKHLRPRRTHQTAKSQITSFGRTNNAPRSKTLTAPQQSRNPYQGWLQSERSTEFSYRIFPGRLSFSGRLFGRDLDSRNFWTTFLSRSGFAQVAQKHPYISFLWLVKDFGLDSH